MVRNHGCRKPETEIPGENGQLKKFLLFSHKRWRRLLKIITSRIERGGSDHPARKIGGLARDTPPLFAMLVHRGPVNFEVRTLPPLSVTGRAQQPRRDNAISASNYVNSTV